MHLFRNGGGCLKAAPNVIRLTRLELVQNKYFILNPISPGGANFLKYA